MSAIRKIETSALETTTEMFCGQNTGAYPSGCLEVFEGQDTGLFPSGCAPSKSSDMTAGERTELFPSGC